MKARRAALIVAAIAAYFGIAVAWLAQVRLRDRSTFPAGSIYNESAEGCALAYRYLQATRADGRSVRVLAQPVGWDPLPSDSVVFRLRPVLPRARVEEIDDRRAGETPDKKAQPRERAPSVPLLTHDEEQWVQAGGHLVVGLDKGEYDVKVGALSAAAPIAKIFPIWPGVTRLAPPVRRAFEGHPSTDGHALFASGTRAVVWRRPLGQGEVLFLSTPEILENRALAQADHLALLVALAGSKRTVYFDEHSHGAHRDDGLLGLLLRWGLGPAVLLSAAAFGLFLWRRRRPVGAYEEAPLPQRSEAVDLIDSMAQLYDRVLSRSDALLRYSRTFEHTVALRTGLSGRPLAARVRAHLAEPPLTAAPGKDIPAAEFNRGLARINNAFRRLEEHAHARRSR